jgi:two-component system alkaline phosphatase synthesis response regulator PhoP
LWRSPPTDRLTQKKAMILKPLVERKGDVVWRDEIIEKVWSDVLPSSRTIDNFIVS